MIRVLLVTIALAAALEISAAVAYTLTGRLFLMLLASFGGGVLLMCLGYLMGIYRR